jgi:hypothetical protein
MTAGPPPVLRAAGSEEPPYASKKKKPASLRAFDDRRGQVTSDAHGDDAIRHRQNHAL